MAVINRQFPGKSDAEIYAKVDQVMEDVARRHSLAYRKDPATRSGVVSLMGASGTFAVEGGQVTVELKYPMLVPGSMRKKVEEDIARKLDGLFA